MAFDAISGTISIISLVVLIAVSISLYINMQNTKHVLNAQMDDLIKQFNDAQVRLFKTTKDQGKGQDELRVQLGDLAKKTKCVQCYDPPPGVAAACPVPSASAQATTK